MVSPLENCFFYVLATSFLFICQFGKNPSMSWMTTTVLHSFQRNALSPYMLSTPSDQSGISHSPIELDRRGKICVFPECLVSVHAFEILSNNKYTGRNNGKWNNIIVVWPPNDFLYIQLNLSTHSCIQSRVHSDHFIVNIRRPKSFCMSRVE